MKTDYSKLDAGVVTLRWKDEESFGCMALFPLTWFRDDRFKRGVTHKIREPGTEDSEATCDVKIDGNSAILDYRSYQAENRKADVLLGEIRLTFGNSQRSLIEKVAWRGANKVEFKPCEFDLTFRLEDITPETVGPRAEHKRLQEIADFLTAVREICPDCAVTKRVGKGWIFVPPTQFTFKPAQNKNLVTFWAGVKHHSIDIRRPRKGRGDNPSSEGKARYETRLLDEYKGRMWELLAERMATDSADQFSAKISALRFRRAYDRFQAIHIKQDGKPFSSFADINAFSYKGEHYKVAIPERARERLNTSTWSSSKVGSGEILNSVQQAIEIRDNNLLQWEGRQGPDSRVHLKMIESRTDPTACRALEEAFFNLYLNEHTDRATFDVIVQHCGRRYELLAYLFFIAQPARFLPVRTKSFDKAFVELGLSLQTKGSCDWDNYNAYCGAIREVQRCLINEGIADATLLDAHSFCWILGRHPIEEVAAPTTRTSVPQPFTGSLKLAVTDHEFTPKEDSTIRDMQAEAQKRQASGLVAEEIAYESECERLRQAGHSNLISRVERVSHKPGLGYDIRSLEPDERERFIEVKNVTKGTRFFLSLNEWLNCKNRENYWFYLVREDVNGKPLVTYLASTDLKEAHLSPIQYLVSFDR